MTLKSPQISIIIPVLNEENYIKKVLLSIKKNTSSKQVKEILVVDGGSEDATMQEAFNAGAIVILPKDFDLEILNAYTQGFKAGCFRMKFDSTNLFLALFAWFTRINTQLCRGGDQSLFILKSLFEKANGFNVSYRIYEDNEFIKRIYKMTSFKVLNNTVTTSSRRYNNQGVLSLQWHFGMIHLKHFFGAGPDTLHRYYEKHIAL